MKMLNEVTTLTNLIFQKWLFDWFENLESYVLLGGLIGFGGIQVIKKDFLRFLGCAYPDVKNQCFWVMGVK